jgi:spore coat polysaccharide biosynthesis protein SpsF
MHWSVDTQADFDFVTAVFERLYPTNPFFEKDDVLALLVAQPTLLDINRGGTGYEGLAKSLVEDEACAKEI